VLRGAVPDPRRWGARGARLAEADSAMTVIEQAVIASGVGELAAFPNDIPPIPQKEARVTELFSAAYRWRTISVWAMCFCYAATSTAMNAWLPTLYRTVYHVSLSGALQLSIATTASSFLGIVIGIFFIDRIGRRKCFLFSFVTGSVPFLILGLGVTPDSPMQVVLLASLGNFFLSWLIPGLYVYMPEIYPTRMRALGAGVGSSWFRVGSIISPTIIGFLIAKATISEVFLFFAGLALIGAVVRYFLVIETRGRVLEEISQ
jgi:putative MFS transporter